MQTSGGDPKGCLGLISSIACGPEAESIRSEVIARRASSERAMVERFERARQDGELPDTIDARGLANYLIAILQGLSLQAGAGASAEQLGQLVDTSLQLWPTR
jgi:hypothetical protein